MKYFIAVVFSLVLVFSVLTGCQQKAKEEAPAAPAASAPAEPAAPAANAPAGQAAPAPAAPAQSAPEAPAHK